MSSPPMAPWCVDGLAATRDVLAVRHYAPSATHTVALHDLATGALQSEIRCEGEPTGLAAAASAFVWEEATATGQVLVVVDPATNHVSRRPLSGKSFVPDEPRLWGDRAVFSRYAIGSPTFVLSVPLAGGDEWRWLSDAQAQASVQEVTANTVVVLRSEALEWVGLDAATGTERWRKEVPRGTWSVTSDGELLAVTSRLERIARWDPASGEVLGSVRAPGLPAEAATLCARDGVLWVQARDEGTPLQG